MTNEIRMTNEIGNKLNLCNFRSTWDSSNKKRKQKFVTFCDLGNHAAPLGIARGTPVLILGTAILCNILIMYFKLF